MENPLGGKKKEGKDEKNLHVFLSVRPGFLAFNWNRSSFKKHRATGKPVLKVNLIKGA